MQFRRLLAATLAFGAAALLTTLSGCQKVNIDTDEAVRQAVVEHLGARGDLGLGELDIAVIQAQFQGDSCQAEVRFVPKGQPVETGMSMRYNLIREGDRWKVKPAAGAASHAMQSPPTPSGEQLVPAPSRNAEGASPQGNGAALPPGHPPLAPQKR